MADLVDLLADAVNTVGGRLAGVSFGLLAAGLAFHVAKLCARSRAWHNIAQAAYPGERFQFRHSLGAYLCGAGTNAVLPARTGDVLKLRLLHHRAPSTRYQGLASTLLTETVFDVATGAVVIAAGIAFGWAFFGKSLPTPFALVAGHPGIAAAVFAGLAVAIGVLWRRLRRVAAGFGRGFRALRQPRVYFTRVASWQTVALALRLASILSFLAAFHLHATPQTALLVLAVQSAANTIPLTPNGSGTQQALLAVALGASAAAFGAGMQLATAALEVILGLVSLALMTGSLDWRRVTETKQPALSGSAP